MKEKPWKEVTGGDVEVTKQELIDIVSEKSGLTKKDTGTVVDILLNTIAETMKRGEKVSLVGFGTFDVKQRKAREGRNPATGETIQIASRVVPSFKAGRALKETLTS